MSTTPITRNSETAKAPQLKGWVEIFRAGTHTDSKGVEFKASQADLDQIVANHALGRAPAVIGHPKSNGPAYAWTKDLRRDGDSLFAAFDDINPAFDDGVALGAYRNRSIRVIRDSKHGLRLRHVGWLGAEPPAIDGLSPDAVDFSADEDGVESFDFTATDDVLGSVAWAMDSQAELMRGLREWVIETNSVETADRVLPSYRIDSLVRAAQGARDAIQRNPGAMFSQPTPAGDDMTITQQQLDEAVAKAKKDGRADAEKDFSAQGQELAELRAQRKQERIDKVINDLLSKGKLLPAQKDGFADFMRGLAETASFEFSAADGSKTAFDPVEYLHDFMSKQAAVVKLSSNLGIGGNGDVQDAAVDVNDPNALKQAASNFQASEKEAGRDISFVAAVQHITTAHATLKA